MPPSPTQGLIIYIAQSPEKNALEEELWKYVVDTCDIGYPPVFVMNQSLSTMKAFQQKKRQNTKDSAKKVAQNLNSGMMSTVVQTLVAWRVSCDNTTPFINVRMCFTFCCFRTPAHTTLVNIYAGPRPLFWRLIKLQENLMMLIRKGSHEIVIITNFGYTIKRK